MENTVRTKGLLAEHGLSFWIDTGEKKILFDTGQGMALNNNARRLNISLNQVSMVVLSHGHYDHCGGLKGVLELASGTKVYAHPDAFKKKYKCNEGKVGYEIGIPGVDFSEPLNAHNVSLIENPTEIAEGVFITGKIPRQNDFEDTGGPFFQDKDCSVPDPLNDDQALFINTAHGIVVLLGCAHSGIINTLEYIIQIAGDKPIHTVMGGMHLINASDLRLKKTIEALAVMGIRYLAPAHCTGPRATAQLWSKFPDKLIACNVGNIFSF